MSDVVILKKDPKIEFQLLDNGFKLMDELTEDNNGFYAYHDLQSIELYKAWFPRLLISLRIFTWILNGVPYFPESYKKAKIIFHFRTSKLQLWLIDIYMANKAKKLVDLLEEKTKQKQ